MNRLLEVPAGGLPADRRAVLPDPVQRDGGQTARRARSTCSRVAGVEGEAGEVSQILDRREGGVFELHGRELLQGEHRERLIRHPGRAAGVFGVFAREPGPVREDLGSGRYLVEENRREARGVQPGLL